MLGLSRRHRFFLLLFLVASVAAIPLLGSQGGVEIVEKVLDWRGWVTLFLLFLIIIALIKELYPPDMILFAGAVVLLLAGVIDVVDLLRSFTRDIIFTLSMLFVVARALEVNGVLNAFSRRILPTTKNYFLQRVYTLLPLGFGSAFLNNTPIVLMMTPVIRRWALDNGTAPSKWLIPVSYMTILGGGCTLIGTSVNLVVDGLLRHASPGNGFAFFELAWVGLPCTIVGFIYLVTVGHHLLPERRDPTTAVTESTTEFTSEFMVDEESPLVGLTLVEASKKYFHGAGLIEIERPHVVIDGPQASEVLQAGDRLVFVGEIEEITHLHSIEGLKSMADPHFKVDVQSSHFSEVIITTTSSLVGKTLKKANFRGQYGASVLAIYRQGRRMKGSPGDVVLRPGDTLMLLSSEHWYREGDFYTDFYHLRLSEKVPFFVPWRAAIVSLILLCMMAVVVLMDVSMFHAAVGAGIMMLLTGSVSIRQGVRSIQWNLLILIGSAFALGAGVVKAGVADYIASFLIPLVEYDPLFLFAAFFILTMVITEVVTNNAAALLVFPIAIEAVRLAGFESPAAFKAVAVTVAIAASFSFVTPIGYQTNTIVYGPGGYKFTDYTKVGLPLSILVFLLSMWIIPRVWVLA